MPTVAPGIDPTMMRAPVPQIAPVPSTNVATEVLPNAMRSTNVATVAMGASGQNHANESLAASASAAPRRRIGGFLIALLLFDAALATAGGLMMRSALARTAAPNPLPAPASIPAAAAPAPTVPSSASDSGSNTNNVAAPARKNPTAAVTDTPSGSAAAAAVAAAVAPDAAGSATPAGKPDAKANEKTNVTNKGKGSAAGPVDPYAGSPTPIPTPNTEPSPTPTEPPPPPLDGEQTAQEESLADQVRRHEVVSRSRLARCYSTASKASDIPLQGAVTVSFQITPQGRVINASAVDNSTESLSLARCVVAEVSKWTFVSDAGAPQDFVRVFKFEGQ